MGESTAELNSDIEETRDRLGTHLDELQDKVSPSAIAGRKKEAARSRILGVRDRALGTARSARDSAPSAGEATGAVSGAASDAADTAKEQFQGAPIAAGVAAFGLGMVISALVPASRAEQRAAVQVKGTVTEQAQPMVDEAKQAVSGLAHDLKDSAVESAQEVKEAGSEAASTVADEGRSSAESVRSETT